MTQDFAKIKPEPLLERRPIATPPAWSLMATGIVVGITIGVFACFLLYLSGNVPALTPRVAGIEPTAEATTAQAATEPVEAELELEFYRALADYEVEIDATPVQLTDQQAGIVADEKDFESGFMLQTGAFQQLELANTEMRRQQILGLDVVVKQQELVGRTLYLVQSGPYTNNRLLKKAESLLLANNIPSLRMSTENKAL